MEILYDALTEYGESDAYPFHMPGHKRTGMENIPPFFKEYYKRDITEIDGFDNLHHPEGILKDAMERAAKLYRSKKTYFLVNGSTAGVLTAVMAAVPRHGSIIMMRNSHRSAYHGLMLGEIKGIYLMSDACPATGLDMGVTLPQVMEAVEKHPEAGAVFLTSPTYEGISMPLRDIAEALHKKNMILIVDAAHGAHFGMADYLPENAVDAGADLVIHSLHKTLPAPTQTALLHVNNDRVDISRVERYLSVFQSSSPSYVMMAGIDECIRILREEGRVLWRTFYENRKVLYRHLKDLKHIRILDAFSSEPESIRQERTKLESTESESTDWPENMVRVKETARPEMGKMLLIPDERYMTAKELYDTLRLKYRLQPEMVTPSYVLIFLTVMDTEEGYRRLADALQEIDCLLDQNCSVNNVNDVLNKDHCLNMDYSPDIYTAETVDNINRYYTGTALPEAPYTIGEACEKEGEWISHEEAAGKISREFIMCYPPGQPVLLPGERITKEMIESISWSLNHGCTVMGIRNCMENSETFQLLCIRDNI